MDTNNTALWVKHLEMVQNTIIRMSAASAIAKNYAVTLLTGVGGLAAVLKNPWIMMGGLLVVIMFAILDIQYLRLERRYRLYYDLLRNSSWRNKPSFQMSLQGIPDVGYCEAITSWSVTWFYSPLIIGISLASVLIELVKS